MPPQPLSSDELQVFSVFLSVSNFQLIPAEQPFITGVSTNILCILVYIYVSSYSLRTIFPHWGRCKHSFYSFLYLIFSLFATDNFSSPEKLLTFSISLSISRFRLIPAEQSFSSRETISILCIPFCVTFSAYSLRTTFTVGTATNILCLPISV